MHVILPTGKNSKDSYVTMSSNENQESIYNRNLPITQIISEEKNKQSKNPMGATNAENVDLTVHELKQRMDESIAPRE